MTNTLYLQEKGVPEVILGIIINLVTMAQTQLTTEQPHTVYNIIRNL